MAAPVDSTLRAFAAGRGANGFTFDELCVAATAAGGSLRAVADWLARAHVEGDLVETGPEQRGGRPAGARRYRLTDGSSENARLDLRLPAEPPTVATMRWAATEYAKRNDAADCDGVRLAVSEAVTNVVLHAYREDHGEVRLVTCAEPGLIVVVVRDWGADGMRPRPDSPGLGVGLPTIATVADAFSVETPDDGGTLLRMHFARSEAA